MSTEPLARLKASGSGSHRIYINETGEFVVEWYDFGDDVPYESANMLILGAREVAALSNHLGLDPGAEPQRIATELADRFGSYFAVRAYLDGAGLEYKHEVDFLP